MKEVRLEPEATCCLNCQDPSSLLFWRMCDRCHKEAKEYQDWLVLDDYDSYLDKLYEERLHAQGYL